MDLLTIYRDGALLAPMDGVVSSIPFDAEDSLTSSAASATDSSAAALAAAYGYSMPAAAAATTPSNPGDTSVLTLYPDISLTITIGIDETDILALQEGQEAEIVVGSVGE